MYEYNAKYNSVITCIYFCRKFGNDRMDSKGFSEAKKQLRLTKDGDLLIVLAEAEKIRPNIYNCAIGEGGESGMETVFQNVLGCL